MTSMTLTGVELRYVLTRALAVRERMTVAELVKELDRQGFAVKGRPTKAVSDALRWRCGAAGYDGTGTASTVPGWYRAAPNIASSSGSVHCVGWLRAAPRPPCCSTIGESRSLGGQSDKWFSPVAPGLL